MTTSCGPAEKAAPKAEPGGPVWVGLEVLERQDPVHPEHTRLAGKKLGLVAHAASVTADGRHAIDVLRDSGLLVVRLFSPEHGLRSRAAAGELVESGKDPVSGLPVVSLYGERSKPRPEELADLDVLVFDLQGSGVRFYTYVSTLILCLQATAEAGIEMVVLDRPDPLGGERIEGPMPAPRELVPASFVNLAPGPLIYGLTLGEMARLVNAGLPVPAKLWVVQMEGWRREMTWKDTGRPWVPPSPNLRSAKAALVYPGTALLEATNVSEGRGTEAPFLLIGAPWLNPAKIQLSVPGFELVPTRFTPTASDAAPDPKYRDEACRGFEIRVTDPAVAQPYQLGLALLSALKDHPEFRWLRGGEALTWLLGTPRVLEELQAGTPPREILEEDRPDHEVWRRERSAFLLY